jgi:hypothetical protein
MQFSPTSCHFIFTHTYLYRKCGTKLSEWPPYSEKLTGSENLQSSSDRFFLASVVNAQGLKFEEQVLPSIISLITLSIAQTVQC